MTAEFAEQDDLTPAERRRRKVRDAIVGAAEDIFAEDGEAGISMRRIAERIDYSPAALYKYFDSKEALFDEIREQFFARLLARMRAVTDRIVDGPKLNGECLRSYVETGLEQPSHYRLAFSTWFAEDAPRDDSYAFAAAAHLESLISESIADGWFEPINPALAATAVWSAAHGLTMLAVTIPQFPYGRPGCEMQTLDDVIVLHARMMTRGFGTEKLRVRLGELTKK